MKKAIAIAAMLYIAACTVAGIVVYTKSDIEPFKEISLSNQNLLDELDAEMVDISADPYHSIKADGYVDIIYEQAERRETRAVGSQRQRSLYAFTVSDSVLRVSMTAKQLISSGNDKIKLYVHAPSLRSVEANGTSSFMAESPVKLEHAFRIETHGAAEIKIGDMSCTDFSAIMHGTGNFICDTIRSSMAQLRINGEGWIHGNVACDGMSIETRGAGSSRVNVACRGTVTASASGAGSIVLLGEAKKLVKSGNVTARIAEREPRVPDEEARPDRRNDL